MTPQSEDKHIAQSAVKGERRDCDSYDWLRSWLEFPRPQRQVRQNQCHLIFDIQSKTEQVGQFMCRPPLIV